MSTGEKGSRTKSLICLNEPSLPFDVVAATQDLRSSDAKLRKLIDRVGPCNLELQHMQNTFETLLESIVYQQLTGKAAATILGRVKDLYSSGFPSPQQVLDTTDDTIRAAGLSRAKLAAIKDLASKANDGQIPDIEHLNSMDDKQIIDTLTKVRGIGEWTVQMLLIFRLGRPDVMPINDYGIRKAFGNIYAKGELPPPATVLKHAERWKPWRTLASWYLWRSLD